MGGRPYIIARADRGGFAPRGREGQRPAGRPVAGRPLEGPLRPSSLSRQRPMGRPWYRGGCRTSQYHEQALSYPSKASPARNWHCELAEPALVGSCRSPAACDCSKVGWAAKYLSIAASRATQQQAGAIFGGGLEADAGQCQRERGNGEVEQPKCQPRRLSRLWPVHGDGAGI